MVHNGSVPLTPTPQTPAPFPEQQGAVNGRSSGRKRTPKSCDCCGPNGKGHDEKNRGETPHRRGRGRGLSGRGRGNPGRGRGHTGRGGALDLGENTPRRKLDHLPLKNVVKTAGQVEGTGEGWAGDATAAQEANQSPTHPAGEQGRDCVSERTAEPERQAEGVSGPGVSGPWLEAEVAGSGVKQQESERCGSDRPDCGMEVEQPPAQTDGTAALSNGTTPTPPPLPPPPPPAPPPAPDQSAPPGTPMEVEPSTQSAMPPGPIVLRTTLHPYAMWDHCNYCKPGTWVQEEDEAPSAQPSTPQPHPADHSHEGIREIVHEFLEHFYMKYGSFIPLSENDVLEHLKKTCNSELNNKTLNIHSEVARYKEGLASAPMMSFMVTYNKHTLTLEDLSTLDEQNWVNDQVINMYGELIMEATQHKIHFFNSFFHRQLVAKGYEGVKRWTKKVDLFSKRLLLIPIHLEIHWSLITVDMTSQHINYYDSQGIVFKHTVDNILRYILSEAKEKKQAVYQKGWKLIVNKGIPQQRNDSDCGVFVLEYCRCLALREPLQFSQEDMPRVRKRIYKELCDCGLSA